MQIEELYERYLECKIVVTDTRQIQTACLFFALKGTTFDGNQFAQQALDAGAKYVVVDDPEVVPLEADERYILVEDTLLTLQALSRHHRKRFTFPVIGLTGTNGKTTTKELIRSVLAQKYRVHATRGNLNNHIGVPLTLLEIRPEDIEMAIIEMGANHIGEIALLSSLAQPTHGLITNIGRAHLEGFGSFEGVKQGKGELYAHLWNNTQGVIFVQADNPILREVGEKLGGPGFLSDPRVFRYGTENPSDQIVGQLMEANPFLKLTWQSTIPAGEPKTSYEVQTQLAGAYNVENVLCAIAVGTYFGLHASEINEGIRSYKPSNNRSQVVDSFRGNRIIGDYYNANASSMNAALTSFSKLVDHRAKVLILGDMFEMGDVSAEEHQRVLEKAMELDCSRNLFIGQAFHHQKTWMEQQGTRFEKTLKRLEFYPSLQDAKTILKRNPIRDSLILLKGSRGVALEGLVEEL